MPVTSWFPSEDRPTFMLWRLPSWMAGIASSVYAEWQKEYRALKKRRPDKSDVWYSEQIANSAVAQGRNASTIKKNMKP